MATMYPHITTFPCLLCILEPPWDPALVSQKQAESGGKLGEKFCFSLWALLFPLSSVSFLLFFFFILFFFFKKNAVISSDVGSNPGLGG